MFISPLAVLILDLCPFYCLAHVHGPSHEEPSLAEMNEDIEELQVVKGSRLFEDYTMSSLRFPDQDYFKTIDEKLFQLID